jgi:lipid-A-disaccharide synthase
VWAWRPRRIEKLRASCDRIALLFPFEATIWRRAGADAHCVGHPALAHAAAAKRAYRQSLALDPNTTALALLPGSRNGEIRRLLPLFLRVARELRQARPKLEARLLLASEALPTDTKHWAIGEARRAGIRVLPGAGKLAAFDAALAASGTVTLECAAAEVPTCIAYRTDPLSAWVARRYLRTEHVGLPNVLLQRRAFPELLQGELSVETLTGTMASLLDNLPEHRESCRRVRDAFGCSPSAPSSEVARLLLPWLS